MRICGPRLFLTDQNTTNPIEFNGEKSKAHARSCVGFDRTLEETELILPVELYQRFDAVGAGAGDGHVGIEVQIRTLP